jgi:hypothetical protein
VNPGSTPRINRYHATREVNTALQLQSTIRIASIDAAKSARLFGIEMTVRLPPKWVFGIVRNARVRFARVNGQ